MKYSIPEQYYCPLHHVRPRFKDNIEEVLIFMANALANKDPTEIEPFREEVRSIIRSFPGNATKEKKTLDNWRTEISALFGFIQSDGEQAWGGRRAKDLAENQDLVQFFKTFLFNFQYPGGHIKTHANVELLKKSVRFKPAQYLLNLLYTIGQKNGKRVGITKAEVCHCIFNDLRCTRDEELPEQVWGRILENREKKVEYDETGDVIRYAGDILDYMEIANLLTCYDGKHFYLNDTETENILKFIRSKEFFTDYDKFMGDLSVKPSDLKPLEKKWFDWVNRDMADTDLSTDVANYIAGTFSPEQVFQIEQLFKKLNETELNTKDIGDCGEALVYGHECQYLKINGREDLVHLVKHIPNVYAVGYDIQSCELNELKKYIEVKSTISRKPLEFFNIHMSANEWNTATTNKDSYYIYRLLISRTDCKLYIMRNPWKLYCDEMIRMVPRNGAEITVLDSAKAGQYVELLKWEES